MCFLLFGRKKKTKTKPKNYPQTPNQKKSLKIPPKQSQPGTHTMHFSFKLQLSLLVALFKQIIKQWHHFCSYLLDSESKLIPSCMLQMCSMASNPWSKQPSPPNAQKLGNCAKSIKSTVCAEDKTPSRCSLNLFLGHTGFLCATRHRLHDYFTCNSIFEPGTSH